MVGKGDDPAKFTTATPRILIITRTSKRGIELTVTDNGPGMAPEIREKILQPLFTTKSFGTGLGLPAVEKILQDHSGGLEITSAQGEGSSFTAWFPIRQPVANAA
jgi:signal transduction histidine kinase